MSRAFTPVKRRQSILDYLNEHGPSVVTQICAAVEIHRKTITSYLRDMRNAGEISVSETWHGRLMEVKYTALVQQTKFQVKVPKHKAGQTSRGVVHLGTERDHPYPNQGGQGAVRYDFGIQSSADLL